MAESKQFSLQVQVVVRLHEDWGPGPVDITATSVDELLGTIAKLRSFEASLPPLPMRSPEDQVQLEQPQETPTQAPAEAPTPQPDVQPGPSVAEPAPQEPATPSATETAEPPSQPSVSLNDVLKPARELLQRPGGEDTLRGILAEHGAESISQADPKHYSALKADIEAKLS